MAEVEVVTVPHDAPFSLGLALKKGARHAAYTAAAIAITVALDNLVAILSAAHVPLTVNIFLVPFITGCLKSAGNWFAEHDRDEK